jgi:hypothetical protein
VHDVLGLDSSERPGEQSEIERTWFDLDLFARGDLIGDALPELSRESAAGSPDRLDVGVEREHASGVGCDAKREATVAAAQLEHTLSPEVAEPSQRGEMRAFWVDDAAQRTASGLYALTVVPWAPNFCAFWRVIWPPFPGLG